MDSKRSLTRSIFLAVGTFFLFHLAVFSLVFVGYQMATDYLLWYLASSLGLHLALLVVLLLSRKDFYLISDGSHLSRVNSANLLTMFRITSLPSMLALLGTVRVYPVVVFLVAYTVLAFVTDYLDGYVARRFGQGTRAGQYLDSMSDYAILIAIAFAFAQFGLVTQWFFIFVLARFFIQWGLMCILFLVLKDKMEPRTSLLGKGSVFMTMIVFACYLLKLFAWFDPILPYLFILELFTAGVLIVSMIEKFIVFARDLRNATKTAKV